MEHPIYERARTILSSAEKEIQRLLEEAVQMREYEAVPALGSLAAHLSRMLNGTLSPSLPPAEGEVDPRGGNGVNDTPASVQAPVRDRSKAARVTYPQFWRDGNHLVKVGWSSANGATYGHKADRRVVDSVARAITTIAAKRRRFQVQDLEKAQRANNNVEIPNYQLYVALAWLRWAGLVVQHGRQGYSLPVPARFLDDLNTAWAQLAER